MKNIISGLTVPKTTELFFTPFKFKFQVRFPHLNAYLDVVWGPEQCVHSAAKALKVILAPLFSTH